eukprot:COSAG02_NODE_3218_length_7155_cov_47.006094_5_plen_53_part_00
MLATPQRLHGMHNHTTLGDGSSAALLAVSESYTDSLLAMVVAVLMTCLALSF